MLYQRRRASEVDDDRLIFELSTMLSREVIRSFAPNEKRES